MTPSWSACSCSSRSIRRPAVDPQPVHLAPGGGGHGVDHVAGLVRHRLDDGAGEVGAGRAPGDADDRAPGVRVPARAAEPGEGGHETTPPVSATEAASGLHLGRRGDDPEAVAQPLDGGAGHEDGALEGVGDVPSASSQATDVSRPSAGGGHRLRRS